ncbi:ATP-binding protein [candidate division WOR-3 bacterium]|nr:ATP-binding protein [candidate division WOR-3 bacterium]
MKKRFLFRDILGILDKRKINVIVGARQVGKTTLLRQLAEHLSKVGEKVYYFTLEDMDLLADFNESPKNLLSLIDLLVDPVVFIDEIQYLNAPSNFLKYLYDMYQNRMRIVVTGSSAFYIEKKFKDSLAGRKRIFIMPTLSFREFLYFKDREGIVNSILSSGITQTTKRELEISFKEFLVFGGYPEVVTAPDIREKKIILDGIVSSYMKRDVFESGIKRKDKFFSLAKILACQIGSLLNKNELSQFLGISTTAVDNYILALQKSFHITLIPPFYTNIKKEIVKMPKLYFNDIGLRNQLLKDFRPLIDRQDKGHILENISFLYLLERKRDNIKYWRSKTGLEIDFVIDREAIEIKYSCRAKVRKQVSAFNRNHPEIPVRLLCMQDYEKEEQYLLKNLLYE